MEFGKTHWRSAEVVEVRGDGDLYSSLTTGLETRELRYLWGYSSGFGSLTDFIEFSSLNNDNIYFAYKSKIRAGLSCLWSTQYYLQWLKGKAV